MKLVMMVSNQKMENALLFKFRDAKLSMLMELPAMLALVTILL